MHLLSACSAALTTAAWALLASRINGPTMIAGAVLAGVLGAAVLCSISAEGVDPARAGAVAVVLVAYQTNLWWAFELNGPYVQAIVNMNVVVIALVSLWQGTAHVFDQPHVAATGAAAVLYVLLGLFIAYTPDAASARSPQSV